jgi:hypothetical protein
MSTSLFDVSNSQIDSTSQIVDSSINVPVINQQGVLVDASLSTLDLSMTNFPQPITLTDLSRNVIPTQPSGYIGEQSGQDAFIGQFYAFLATGGFTIEQGFATVKLIQENPLSKYDMTNALQVKYDVALFNKKLGIVKDATNKTIVDSSFIVLTDRFPNDIITITADEFVQNMTPQQVISVGTYYNLYSDYVNYVSTYFGYSGGYASLFSQASEFNINNGVFDASAFVNIINGHSADPSGNYINNLTGSISIYNINNLLRFAIDGNVFGNRNPASGNTASDPNNPSNYGMADGFEAGDIILVPNGTTITLKLMVDPELYSPANNIGPTNVSNLTQQSNFIQKYGSNNYTETSSASYTNITRVLTAPLMIKLVNFVEGNPQ